MATFSTMASAEARCKAQMVAKVWVVAHSAKDFNGQIICRFQRYMSPAHPDYGAWIETNQDNVN